MFIVSYLYNNNGMGSWCWEAAHALREHNKPVILVCSPTVSLPGQPEVDILRFQHPFKYTKENKLYIKFLNEFNRLSAQSSGFVYDLHRYLINSGIKPTAYLLNQSNLQDSRINIPQYVVGWAYPTTFFAYQKKIPKLIRKLISISSIRICFDSIGWWRKDWRGYRSATGVLAVSSRLREELNNKSINAFVVYPGTNVIKDFTVEKLNNSNIKLLIAALDLEDPRKRIRWMIEALRNLPFKNFSLTLIGKASDKFKNWVCRDNFPAKFVGFLPRSELNQLMLKHEVFLFGSCLDDWGYVLIEAMSNGLLVVAPNLSPFDEIVDDTGALYSPYSSRDFISKVNKILNNDLDLKRQASLDRAKKLFSREIFGNSILSAIADFC